MESSLNSHFHLLAEPTFGRPKKIRVWINGNLGKQCFDVTLNPNVLRTWNTVLQYLTHTIHPPFGSIRKLVCLSSKKAITCFEELDSREKYIALGANSKLIIMKQGYKSPSEQELLKPKKSRKQFYSGDMNSTNFQFLQDTKKRNLTVIYIVVNGQACQFPTKVVLNENDLGHWNVSLKYLSKILDVPEGIQHVCTIFGDIVTDPSELQHGFLYVALPFNEKFEKIDYTNTFGRATNKSSYVLKIRKKMPPNKVCCPIKILKSKKADCSGERCLKKFSDERECSDLLPEEIPESCRTVRIEEEKVEEGINKGKDCCLLKDETHLWCKIKKYNPGCCEKDNLSGGIGKEKTVKKQRPVMTRKKIANEFRVSSLPVDQSYKTNSPKEDAKKNEEKISFHNDLTTKDSTPTKQCNEEEAAQEKQSGSKINSRKLIPAQDNIQMDQNVQENMSLHTIGSSVNVDPNSIEADPQNDIQIVTYFSTVDSVYGRDKKSLISTTISRGIQTVQCRSHHVTISSVALAPSVFCKENTYDTQYQADFSQNINNANSMMGKNENSIVDKNFVGNIIENYSKFDKCLNTKISLISDSKFSQLSEFQKPHLQNGEKVHKGISAILSELNVYPDHEPKRMPSICIKNITDINVGYSNNRKRFKGEKCYESSSFSESPSTPEYANDRLCCFCREARKQNRSISRPVRCKCLSESKKNRRSEELLDCTEVILENHSGNIAYGDTPNETDNTSINTVSRKNGLSKERLLSSHISGTIDNNKKISVEKFNDIKLVAVPDTKKNELNTGKRDSTQPKNLVNIPEDSVPPMTSKDTQRSLPGRKSNSRNKSTSSAQRLVDTIEDKIPFTNSRKSQNTENNVSLSNSEKEREGFKEKESTHRHSAISTVQKVMKTIEENIPFTESRKSQNIEDNSEKKQDNVEEKKSTHRHSAISTVQKVMKTIEDNIPFTDPRKSQNIEDNVALLNSEKEQENFEEKKSTHRNSATSTVQKIMKTIEDGIPFIDSGKTQNNVPFLNSEKDQEYSNERKSAYRNSATSTKQKTKNIEVDIPTDPRKSQNIENQENSTGRKSSHRNSIPTADHPKSLNSLEKNHTLTGPQEISSARKTSKRNSYCRERRTGQCKLRYVEKIPEKDTDQVQSSVPTQSNCASESYSRAILNVKKILEHSMAEINEVLTKKEEPSDEKTTDEVLPEPVVKNTPDRLYSSDSSSDVNTEFSS